MSDHITPPVVVDQFLDVYVMEQTRIRARELTDKSHLPPEDWEDIQQEMVIKLLKAKRRFNPAKAGKHTFASRVLDCFCKDFIRKIVRTRRRGYLDTPCADLGEEFSLDQKPIGKGVLHDLVRSQTCQAVQEVLDDFPEDLRPVCDAMLHTEDRKEIAEQLGIARSSLYRRIVKIRSHFEAAGLTPE